jgi:hypothetical protein
MAAMTSSFAGAAVKVAAVKISKVRRARRRSARSAATRESGAGRPAGSSALLSVLCFRDTPAAAL